jgi:hypothetical protein
MEKVPTCTPTACQTGVGDPTRRACHADRADSLGPDLTEAAVRHACRIQRAIVA